MDTMKVVTWNVKGIVNKEYALAKILSMKKTDIAVIAKTKKKLKGSKCTENYLMLYTGVDKISR